MWRRSWLRKGPSFAAAVPRLLSEQVAQSLVTWVIVSPPSVMETLPAHEKGGVGDEDGQFRLAAASKEGENRVIEGRAQAIGAARLVEREQLLPQAEEGFDLASPGERT